MTVNIQTELVYFSVQPSLTVLLFSSPFESRQLLCVLPVASETPHQDRPTIKQIIVSRITDASGSFHFLMVLHSDQSLIWRPIFSLSPKLRLTNFAECSGHSLTSPCLFVNFWISEKLKWFTLKKLNVQQINRRVQINFGLGDNLVQNLVSANRRAFAKRKLQTKWLLRPNERKRLYFLADLGLSRNLESLGDSLSERPSQTVKWPNVLG